MPLFAFTVCAFFLGVACLVWYRTTHPTGLPPGPKGHWLWGSDFPEQNDFLQYDEWKKQYGSVYSLRNWTDIVVVIGGMKAATDILEKQGAVTNDRPRKVAGSEIRCGGMRTLLVRVGKRLTKLRRALHLHMQSRAAKGHEATQQINAHQLIQDILDRPGDFFSHTQRYSVSSILTMAYGKSSTANISDSDVALVYECLHNLGQALRPGAWLVDHIPWLKHIPFYAPSLREQHKQELSLFDRQLQSVRHDLEEGSASHSFGRYLLENQLDLELSDKEISYLAGSMFGAGADTTASALRFIIMAAACFPEAQKVVQQELDTVVGHERLAAFSDWDSAPQLRAFVLETFRWRPVSAAGVHHRATQEIVWNDYVIPAGATLVPNHWSIGRDPEFFPDGDTFRPGRWLDEEGRLSDRVPQFPNFGFGRRICPGKAVAERSVFINAALLLQSFNIVQDVAMPIDTFAFTQGVNLGPAPFHVNFQVRNPAGEEGLRALIESLS